MERKTFRDRLLLGSALLGVWFVLNHVKEAAGFLHTLWVILSPFVLGAALAFVLNVPMSFLEKRALGAMDRVPWLKKWKRAAALVLTLLLTVLVIYLVMALVVPEVASTIETVGRAIPPFIQQADEWLAPYEFKIS